MFKFIIRLTFVIRIVLSLRPSHSGEPDNLLTWKSCNYGDTIENVCNKCVCTSKGVYDCEPRECLPTEVHLHSQEVCHPNTVYNQGSTTCICTAAGQWPHKTCHDIFRSLPENSITKKTCKPNGYFKVDCNVCRCNANGAVDTTRCTLNECDDQRTFRKSDQPDPSQLFGVCLVKNWYSLAPCQFCYCMDTNKLICSTSVTNANKGKEMALGQSNLVLCGAGLLKEVASLVPGSKAYRSIVQASQIGRILPHEMDVTRAIKSTEEVSKETLDYDEGNKVKDGNKGLRAGQVSEENNEYYEGNAKEQSHRDGNNKGIKSKDVKINLAATLHAELKPHKVRQYDPFIELGKFLKSNRKRLTLDGAAKCKPGSITTVKCNTCHCLKNGKMLCTDKKCD